MKILTGKRVEAGILGNIINDIFKLLNFHNEY